MDLPELGKVLRRFRKSASLRPDEAKCGYKRMTQELFATRLGWNGASHISEIENGRRLPSPETLSRWIDACDGSPADLHYVMGLAGYIPPTRLPHGADLIAVLNETVEQVLTPDPYPVYIIDYRNMLWACNGAATLFFDSREMLARLMCRPVNLFHFLFDPRLPVMHLLQDIEAIQQRQIHYFKALNILRRHEPFYCRFPQTITADLPPDAGRHFESLWMQDRPDAGIAPFLIEQFTFDLPQGKVTFQLHDQTIKNFADLFAVVHYRPDASIEGNIRRAQQIVAPYRNTPPLKLWTLLDIQSLIDRHNSDRHPRSGGGDS